MTEKNKYMNIRYKTKWNSLFFQYATKIRKGYELHLHVVWKMPTLHRTCSRMNVLSLITVVPSYYHFYASFGSRFTLELYNLIASYYTKGKWQWRQGYLFCSELYHFDISFHLLIFPFLIWRVHLIRSCIVWKQKFVFVIGKSNVSIFSNSIRLQLSPNR